MNLIRTNGFDALKLYDGATVQVLVNASAGCNFVDQHDISVYMAVGNTVHVVHYAKPMIG
jgi:hypothetical protein